MKIKGTPVRFEFRTGGNPFEGKRNILTPRQQAKKERQSRHIQEVKKRAKKKISEEEMIFFLMAF